MILQISIPFCFKRCSYCAYPHCAYDPKVIRAYVQAVITEIESVQEDMAEYTVTAIAIEGGSPALASPEGLSQILHAVSRNFRLADDVQISLQTMPGDYSRALMEKMRDAGVNFWIVGLQTAQREEHELLQRSYKFDAITMVDMAIRTFLPRLLSFDLLLGIPGQTPHSFEQTLRRTLSYQPDHITLYQLRLTPGTSLFDKVQSQQLSLPGQVQMEEALRLAQDILRSEGLLPYTERDYARPGCENRFRQEQRKGTEQLGIGYRSLTRMEGVTYTSGHSLQEYIDHSGEFDILVNGLSRVDPAEKAEA